jgi:hypothetical protein
MNHDSDALVAGLILLGALLVLVPAQSFELAIRLQWVSVPNYPPALVGFWARSVKPSSKPRFRAFESLFALAIINLVALVFMLPIRDSLPNPTEAASAAFFLGEAIWVWWLLRFIKENPGRKPLLSFRPDVTPVEPQTGFQKLARYLVLALFAVLILISLLEGLTIVLMGLPPGIAAIVVAALALLVGVLVRWGWMRRRRRRI